MQSSRFYNSARNIVAGFLRIITMTIFPFIIRTIIIYKLGYEYSGLGSLFSSIFGILNISELGIASTIVYFLYEPIANHDIKRANAYLNTLRKLYYVIGLTIFCVGIIVLPFLPKIITSSYPSDINIYLLYLLFLINGVNNYLDIIGAASACTILVANQRTDLENNVWTFTSLIFYIVEIIILCLFKSYYFYVIITSCQIFVVGIFRRYYVRKYFPDFFCEGNISKADKFQILKKVIGLFGNKADTTLLNGVDNVFLSMYLGLKTVTIYANYFFVITAVEAFFSMIFGSITASIGNAIAIENKEDNYNRFLCLYFANSWITALGTICLICLYQVFMLLWMGADKSFPFAVVICFCLYFYIAQIRRVVITFKDANGMWWNDKYRPYVSMIINLLLDLVLIKKIGASGAIIASLVAVFCVDIPWETYILFRDYFGLFPKKFIVMSIKWIITTLIVVVITYHICAIAFPVYGIVTLVGRLMLCLTIPNLLFFVLYGQTTEFKTWKNEILIIFKGNR